MSEDVLPLSISSPSIRAIVGPDPDAFALLVMLARCGEVPATKTKSSGFMVSRHDLPLITRIFKEFQRN